MLAAETEAREAMTVPLSLRVDFPAPIVEDEEEAVEKAAAPAVQAAPADVAEKAKAEVPALAAEVPAVRAAPAADAGKCRVQTFVMCDADTEEALSYYDIEDAYDFEVFVERSRDDVAGAARDQGAATERAFEYDEYKSRLFRR